MLAHAQSESQPNLKRRKYDKKKQRKSNVSVTSRLRRGVPNKDSRVTDCFCFGSWLRPVFTFYIVKTKKYTNETVFTI